MIKKSIKILKLNDVSIDMHQGINTVTESVEYLDNGIPIIQSKNITSGYLDLDDVRYLSEKDYLKYKQKYQPRLDDVLVCNIGTIGKSLRIREDNQFLIAWNLFIIKLDKNLIFSQYFAHYLNYLAGLKYFDRFLTGGTVKFINKKTMQDIPIPLPPLPVQQKIAAILDAADAYRQKTKALIDKYDQLAQSLFLDMFGDPVKNEKKLKIVKLKDVTTKITDGVHAKPNYTESGVPFISVKDITTGILKFDDCKFISKEDHEKFTKRCAPEYLDVLYTKVGATYGRPAIIDTKKEFSIYVSVALIKPDHSKINPYFLKDALANPAVKKQADKSIKGIGVPDLHLNMIQEFLIPLPDFSQQQLFADRIEVIEAQKQQAHASLQKAEELFASLLQWAFSGELV